MTFAHDVPLPIHPALHAHVKLAGVSVHDAVAAQLCSPAVHSGTDVHCIPLPVYPLLHAQLYPCISSVHTAFA